MNTKEKLDLQKVISEGIPRFTKLLVFHPLMFWLMLKYDRKFLLRLLKGRADYETKRTGWIKFAKHILKESKFKPIHPENVKNNFNGDEKDASSFR